MSASLMLDPSGTDVDFDLQIQPIFRARCSPCHTGQQKAGGLSLDSHSALMKGGDSGPAIKLDAVYGSLLLQRMIDDKLGPRMPLNMAPLKREEIELIGRWLSQGGKPSALKAMRQHWAYTIPVKPAIPAVKDAVWAANPIDAFVYTRLLKEGLRPSPEADRRTLIRRASLDLTGLPPTPGEIQQFVLDRSLNAYEKVVDRLLASPHYGERMVLPWLDAARYADSNGFQQDGDTFQYVWRDWVVNALNANMPFDVFTREQLAGDLLPNPTVDQLVATGFNRNPMLNGEGGAIPEEQRNVLLFDRVDTTSTTWLGLTMTCARCHDHKYDPILQKDYFRLMAFFNNVPETGVPAGGGQYRIADPWIYAGNPDQMSRLNSLEAKVKDQTGRAGEREDIAEAIAVVMRQFDAKPPSNDDEKAVQAILSKPDGQRTQDEKNRLREYALDHGLSGEAATLRAQWKQTQGELDRLKAELPRVMVMSDAQPRKTHLLFRGNYEEPLAEVQPGTPSALPGGKTPAKNRLDLVKWILSPRNPLTARVAVNRAWQLFFGHGLVRTEENFGVRGEPPTHPELLDWLALHFRESGWNVKALHKLIVMSRTYRQTSKVSKTLLGIDPENRLYARGARFRLPSLLLRDVALASSGLLNPKLGGKPVYPYQPKGIWDALQITEERDFTYPSSKGEDNYRRSLYTFWRRTVAPGNMFDASSRQVCTVKALVTSTPMHALTMLNDVTWVEAGRALAARVWKAGSPEARMKEAFQLVCARYPDSDELKTLMGSLGKTIRYYSARADQAELYLNQGEYKASTKIPKAELAAMSSVCTAMFNLDEAMTRE